MPDGKACVRPDILIFLPWEPPLRSRYEELIRARHPELPVRTVSSLAEARQGITTADVFMAFGANLREDIFGDARCLRWVHALGTGVDGIVDQPGLHPDVLVTATRGIHGPPLSELAILLMLSLARDFPRSVRAQQRQAWDKFRARLLHGRTAGILGVGQIAADLAPRLKALGLTVVGFSRTARDVPGFDRMVVRDELRRSVADLDFLVLLVPLEAETRGMVDAGVLAAMKPGSFLVNIARGGVLDEAALVSALESGHLGGAALDVTIQEPLPPGDRLWTAPNLILTPHLGGFYDRYPEDSIEQILANIACFRAGETSRMINLEPRT